MASQEMLGRARPGRMGARTAIMPEIPVRLVAALFALGRAAWLEAALITLSAGMLATTRLAPQPRPGSG